MVARVLTLELIGAAMALNLMSKSKPKPGRARVKRTRRSESSSKFAARRYCLAASVCGRIRFWLCSTGSVKKNAVP